MHIWSKNGKFLGFFDKKEEARNYLRRIINYYNDHQGAVSIKSLANEARKANIMITERSLSKWVKDEGFPIYHGNSTESKQIKEDKTFVGLSISTNLNEFLNQIPKKSRFVDTFIKGFCGFPTKDLIVVFDDNLKVVIYTDHGNVYADIIGVLHPRDEKVVRTLINRAQEHGLDVIKEYCDLHGFLYFGATEQTPTDEIITHRRISFDDNDGGKE